jgi:hypothetical protein
MSGTISCPIKPVLVCYTIIGNDGHAWLPVWVEAMVKRQG